MPLADAPSHGRCSSNRCSVDGARGMGVRVFSLVDSCVTFDRRSTYCGNLQTVSGKGQIQEGQMIFFRGWFCVNRCSQKGCPLRRQAVWLLVLDWLR